MSKNKYVEFNEETRLKIAEAVGNVLEGICARVDVNKNVKVYTCRNIIRIDLKVVEEE